MTSKILNLVNYPSLDSFGKIEIQIGIAAGEETDFFNLCLFLYACLLTVIMLYAQYLFYVALYLGISYYAYNIYILFIITCIFLKKQIDIPC